MLNANYHQLPNNDNNLIEIKINNQIDTTIEEQKEQEGVSPRRTLQSYNFPEMVGHHEQNGIIEQENILLYRFRLAVISNLFLSCLYSLIFSPLYLIYCFLFSICGMFIGNVRDIAKMKLIVFYIGISLLFLTNIIINAAIVINEAGEFTYQIGLFVGVFIPLIVINLVFFRNPFEYLRFISNRNI